jgi:hypothetical protein
MMKLDFQVSEKLFLKISLNIFINCGRGMVVLKINVQAYL